MKFFQSIAFVLSLVFCVKAFPNPSPTPGDPIKRVGRQQDDVTLPVAKIYQVDSHNRIVRPWTKIDEQGETVLENVDKVRLECTSDYHPVQWVYFGHGAPILTSNVTFSRVKSRNGQTSTEYVATALISPVKEHHTGKYICTSADNLDTRTFFYIYVPGPTLFSALNGQDILIPKNDSKILIPCTVSNPDVKVTLEKSINDVLQRVNPSLVTYDPRKGATLDISQLEKPEGIYVCTALYNNLVRGIEYTLRYPSNQPLVYPQQTIVALSKAEEEETTCQLKCGDNAHCEKNDSGKESCVCNPEFRGNPKDACEKSCKSHEDCPSNTVCFSDLKCRDPCVHSIRCGQGAKCRIENTFPVCYCPENFVGDPKQGCINALQQDAPPSSLKNVTSSVATTSSSQCDRKCGDQAFCVIEKGRETCKCRGGAVECDIPCQTHTDCPDTLSCNVLYKCHSPCIHNIRCGEGAKCEVIDHRPNCFCPRDSVGDPMKQCTSGYQGDQPTPSQPDATPAPPSESNPEDKCKKDEECASHEKCMKLAVDKGRQCFDPCQNRRCGTSAVCQTQDHRTFCVCKDGFDGNANRECRPIKYEDGAVEPLRQNQPQNCTKPEACGPFSKCTMDKDGKPKCDCLEGHLGDAPNCAVECETNSDCPSNHLCLRDSRLAFPYCAKVCGNKICGAGSLCREANGVIPSECVCPVGFGGDPYLHCKNLNEKLGQDCQTDKECGDSLRCETGQHYRKCVDPCAKLKCAENLECSVQNHQASCVCVSGYTGNPSIGCTKDLEFNVSTLGENPCKNLRCGPHSECRFDSAGKPTCSCRSYAKGEPPSCYQECRTRADCEVGLTCVQKQCRHACDRCGNNTKCVISRNPEESQCSCLEGFEGDPLEGCKLSKA